MGDWRHPEELLTQLGDSIVWPGPSERLVSQVRARTESDDTHGFLPLRNRFAPALAAAVIALVILAVPSARQAVADLLIEAGVVIRFVEDTPTPGAGLDLGIQVDLEEAANQVEFELRIPAALGEPDAVYIEGARVSAVWERPIRFRRYRTRTWRFC